MQSTKMKTLIRYTLPSILSSTCYFLFTVIDGIFIGRGVGTDALGAINILFPFIMIANALFLLTGVGGVSVVAVRMGRGDYDGANKAFLHSLSLTALFSALLFIVGTLLPDLLTSLLGGGDEIYSEYCHDYLFWYSVFFIPSGLSMAMQNYCRNDSDPILVSVAVIFSTLFNIFADWLFIFPLDMGMKGAAIATGISQTLGFIIVLFHFILKRGHLRIHSFKLSIPLIGKIFKRGAPECIAQFSVPVSTICMNYVLLDLQGPLGVNTYSLMAYVACFAVAVFAGTAQGLQPLFGQSFGAKNRHDLSFFLKSGIVINLVGSGAINVMLLFVGASICSLFGADGATLAHSVKNMPFFAWGFIVESMNSILSAYLYSTKRTKEAVTVNVLRSFIFNTLITLVLPYVWTADCAVWNTFGIYQALVMIVAIIITRRSDKKMVL